MSLTIRSRANSRTPIDQYNALCANKPTWSIQQQAKFWAKQKSRHPRNVARARKHLHRLSSLCNAKGLVAFFTVPVNAFARARRKVKSATPMRWLPSTVRRMYLASPPEAAESSFDNLVHFRCCEPLPEIRAILRSSSKTARMVLARLRLLCANCSATVPRSPVAASSFSNAVPIWRRRRPQPASPCDRPFRFLGPQTAPRLRRGEDRRRLLLPRD